MSDTTFNSDSAREAGIKSGESRRQKREEAERIAQEAWREGLTKALDRHIALLDAENDPVALAAVKEIYDRLLGRAAQALEISGADGGPMTIRVVSGFADDDGDGAVQGDPEAEPASPSLEGPADNEALGIGGDQIGEDSGSGTPADRDGS